MSEPDGLLDGLLDEVVERGWRLNEPAAPAALAAVAEWYRERTGTALPAACRALLARTDGLDFNGAVVYASGDGRTRDGVFVAGLAESNKRLGDAGGTWFGEANGDLFGLLDGEWVVVAKSSRVVVGRHGDAAALLVHVLRAYLDV